MTTPTKLILAAALAAVPLAGAARPAAAQSVITGAGGSISTDKNGNVRISGAEGGSITKSGGKTTITDAGGGSVSHGSSRGRRAGGAAITLSASHVHRTYQCNGGPVTVSGNDNVLTLRGTCSSITASGNRNTFAADTVGSVVTSGAGNRVTYAAGVSGARPSVSDTGSGNSVAVRQ